MTKTTAKKGMLQFKSGHGKEDFDYNFIKDIPYGGSDKTVDEIIKGFMSELETDYKRRLEKMNEHIDKLENELTTLRNAYENVIKGVLQR